VALGLVLALVAAACGGGDDDGDGRPLTDEEAGQLANVLFDNYRAQGAEFELAMQVAPGATINLQGEIDWSTHRGHARVVGSGTEEGIQEVYWDDETVLERRDALNALLAQSGQAGVSFVARPVDLATRDLDQALALVTALASQQRDNPLLIQQADGAEFARTDELRGVDAVVLRGGPLTTYWLAADDGRMLRFEGNNSPGTRPVVVDVTAFGPREIAGPPQEQVISVDGIQEIYDGFTGAAPG
jgi:hypothetical protein